MPHKVTSGEKSRAKTNVERARNYLSSGGVARDDSDDELGLEDHPWEWIYAESAPGEEEKDQRRRKKKDRVATAQDSQRIIGARMGTFECRLGDCVFLKADGASNEAWIGIISNFEEDEEDEQKCANFMWFSTEKEIRNKQRKRTDAMQVRAPAFSLCFWGGSPLSSVMLEFEHALKSRKFILSYIAYVNLLAFADSSKQIERGLYHAVVGYQPSRLHQRKSVRRVPSLLLRQISFRQDPPLVQRLWQTFHLPSRLQHANGNVHGRIRVGEYLPRVRRPRLTGREASEPDQGHQEEEKRQVI